MVRPGVIEAAKMKPAPYYDITMRNKPRPVTADSGLAAAVEELKRLTEHLIESGKKEKVVSTPDNSAAFVAELKSITRAVTQAMDRKQEAPVVKVDHHSPAINFPENKAATIQVNIPEIRIPEIKIPEFESPDVTVNATVTPQPRTWKFQHKYDVYNKLIETIATPQ